MISIQLLFKQIPRVQIGIFVVMAFILLNTSFANEPMEPLEYMEMPADTAEEPETCLDLYNACIKLIAENWIDEMNAADRAYNNCTLAPSVCLANRAAAYATAEANLAAGEENCLIEYNNCLIGG